MARQKTTYICQTCGSVSSKWLGKCPECNEWNSFVEEVVEKKGSSSSSSISNYKPTSEAVLLDSVVSIESDRIKLGVKEFDQVLGGGIVAGSVILIGGEPGIGKSTIILQIAGILSGKDMSVVYLTGEESLTQIKMRSDRLGADTSKISLLSTTSFEDLLYAIEKQKFDYIIVDSIQTINSKELLSVAGTVSQIRYITYRLVEIAKQNNITVFIVGQVTKDGSLGGPKTLEHLVDTVLYFEGDFNRGLRILRTVKNRFGSTDEVGIFEMTVEGLVESSSDVLFMDSGNEKVSGRVLTTVLEGSRPFIVEIQALVVPTFFQYPKRNSTGFDQNRLTMLIAIVEKKLGINLSAADVYLNVAGGLKIKEPSADLAVIVAILSSFKDIVIGDDTVFVGEVGLTSQVRQTSNMLSRMNESKKFGIKKMVTPYNKGIEADIKIIDIKEIKDLIGILNLN